MPAPTSIAGSLRCRGGVLAGTLPPRNGGYGTFAFCGGDLEALLRTSGCPSANAVFYFNKPDGTFIAWIPGSSVAAPNLEFLARFTASVPRGTIFTVRCR